MFNPKTERIEKLAASYPSQITELEGIFDKKTNIYIDYANVRPWAEKLGWHIELKRLKQLFDSFDMVNEAKLYHGTLKGDMRSEDLVKEIIKSGYSLKTKPVKIMKASIDTSSISMASPDLLAHFIRKPLLRQFTLETIEYLNNQLKSLNDKGVFFIEDRKCNFDVEIGRDMLTDYDRGIENFILWSGDSDFVNPIQQLLGDSKKVFIFATVRKVAAELNDLRTSGLLIYDIQKIREFICWVKEMKDKL